ncbi:hypothetical protein Hypma_011180 [Hypsizygus marmoreus]|uniref:Uncharacterized protein n=1 Tax=Hypsizygus marmoreus TaxID=39966 RepID=A0A369JPH4_HYPMA|nr:hypothetical protein Hypma_011180 [Hypsizygus marmoreus]
MRDEDTSIWVCGGKGGKWETRTERNLRELRSGEGSDEEEDRDAGGGVSAAMSMGAGCFVPMSTSMSTTPSTPTPKPRPVKRASVNGREGMGS